MSAVAAQMQVLRWLWRHPLTQGRRPRAIASWLAWHLGSRLVPGPVAVPFVDDTVLLVGPGMSGATLNVYAGLAEPEDMAFVLHVLRAGDLFVDVGANVGAYTVLASAAAGAETMAFEPVPATFALLARNVRLNGCEALVDLRNAGLGDVPGTGRVTTGRGAENHVVAGTPSEPAVETVLHRLDDVLGERPARFLKIDVEGFEQRVLRGSVRTLACPELLGVLVELNGGARRYEGRDDAAAVSLERAGFVRVAYDPAARRLATWTPAAPAGNNALYVRNPRHVQALAAAAPRHRLRGGWL
jgi:FkbM family methyltransferase